MRFSKCWPDPYLKIFTSTFSAQISMRRKDEHQYTWQLKGPKRSRSVRAQQKFILSMNTSGWNSVGARTVLYWPGQGFRLQKNKLCSSLLLSRTHLMHQWFLFSKIKKCDFKNVDLIRIWKFSLLHFLLRSVCGEKTNTIILDNF
jgi:hypothetical protein